MSKIENGKPKIYFGDIKMSILAYEVLFKEEFAKVYALNSKMARRISKLESERKVSAIGGSNPENKR